jgi:4-amino-4-deoxy-L-arabinose transferase-like glycosyltransferase
MPIATKRLLFAYFFLAFGIAPVHLLSFDSYYYWEWSRHLDWSYFDGSPMIAYLIRAFTGCLGDNLFALSSLSLVMTAATAVVLYRTARLFLTVQASTVSLCLWLFSPLITLDLLNQVTLNTPLTLFWALTLYYSIRYLTQAQHTDLYWVGLMVGLMLLSKYSGIVLVLGIVIFLLITPYRRLFLSPVVYLAAILAIALFSPVIIWNAQHHWQSFHYQLHTHSLNQTHYSINAITLAAVPIILSALNIMLLPPLIYWRKRNVTHSLPAQFCFTISTVFLIFYLLIAGIAHLRGYWLSQYLLTASLLAGFCLQHQRQTIGYRTLITLYAAISVGIIINATTLFNLNHSKKIAYYQWVQAFNRSNLPAPDAVITNGWMQARLLFFLKNHPAVYTIDCGEPQNQYTAWSKPLLARLDTQQIQRVWYFDLNDPSACLSHYFQSCKKLTDSSLVFAYECTKPRPNLILK